MACDGKSWVATARDLDEPSASDILGQHTTICIGSEKRQDVLLMAEPLGTETTTPRRSKAGLLALVAAFALSIWRFTSWVPHHGQIAELEATASVPIQATVRDSAPTPTVSILDVFQVHQPVWTESRKFDATARSEVDDKTDFSSFTKTCEVLLMEHSFGFSYGKPFIGDYTPPNCKFNRVVMNFTVTSRGRQFDRLALMYFNDTEVWRTSTAEPTVNGIRWEYTKDMSAYMYFWKSPQRLIFDLGNLIDDTYTGPFNTTLTATFFNTEKAAEAASLILPISARKGAQNAASVFMLPSDNATNSLEFPRNANRAVFSVSACGQAAEEFWWSNVLQSDVHTFENETGTLYGYSPFREVQVLIDGQLAGVQWPFPVIFTGGVVPGLWRPIVGIDAFDLREHEIDITPWLPLLCNGHEHSFEIRVVGIQDDGMQSGNLTKTVGDSWYVTGKIFVWLDEDSHAVTTGRDPTILLPAPVIYLSQALTKSKSGANETLNYTVDVKRVLSISSLITTQSGSRLATWTQNLAVSNFGLFTNGGLTQQNNQTTIGVDQSTGGIYYKASYTYPLYANSTYLADAESGNFSIDADLVLGMSLDTQGMPVHPTGAEPSTHNGQLTIPKTSLSTTQNGTAHYFASPRAGQSTGFGSTSQDFGFWASSSVEPEQERYHRSVAAMNGTVVRDHETLQGVRTENDWSAAVVRAEPMPVVESPREVLGRGPGRLSGIFVPKPMKGEL